jgi:hypothetical protein
MKNKDNTIWYFGVLMLSIGMFLGFNIKRILELWG